MPRTSVRPAPLLASLAVHAALAALLWAAISVHHARPDFVSVRLVGRPAAPRGIPQDRPEPSSPPLRPSRPARGSASPRAARPSVTTLVPGAPPAPSLPSATLGRGPSAVGPGEPPPGLLFRGSPTADYWITRSLAVYVNALRRGEAPQDSILDRPRMPEEVALERTERTLNDLTDRLRWDWALERFREAYAENFPAMQ